METRHELEELRARQRRQRATIQAATGIRSTVSLNLEPRDLDATEIQVRLVAAELVRTRKLGPELDVLEIAQARRSTRDFMFRQADSPPDWVKKATNRLRDCLAQDNEAGVLGPDEERQHLYLDILALLQAADELAPPPGPR